MDTARGLRATNEDRRLLGFCRELCFPNCAGRLLVVAFQGYILGYGPVLVADRKSRIFIAVVVDKVLFNENDGGHVVD